MAAVDVNVNMSNVMIKVYWGFSSFVCKSFWIHCALCFASKKEESQAKKTSSHEDYYDFVPVDTGLTSVTFRSQRFQNPNSKQQEHSGNVHFQEKYFCCLGQCKDFTIGGSGVDWDWQEFITNIKTLNPASSAECSFKAWRKTSDKDGKLTNNMPVRGTGDSWCHPGGE